jgi:hypothetical protein
MCPANGDMTHVPCVVTLEAKTSDVLMTFDTIRHRLDASCAEVTFDVIRHTESLSSDPASPRPRLGRSPTV